VAIYLKIKKPRGTIHRGFLARLRRAPLEVVSSTHQVRPAIVLVVDDLA
jgi:hypothetical protein